MLEALNIRYIGPNLDLVPRAETNDGLLDVVFVAKGEQAKLWQCISDRLKHTTPACEPDRAPGTALTGRVEADANRVLSIAIDIKTDPGALVFLKPG